MDVLIALQDAARAMKETLLRILQIIYCMIGQI